MRSCEHNSSMGIARSEDNYCTRPEAQTYARNESRCLRCDHDRRIGWNWIGIRCNISERRRTSRSMWCPFMIGRAAMSAQRRIWLGTVFGHVRPEVSAAPPHYSPIPPARRMNGVLGWRSDRLQLRKCKTGSWVWRRTSKAPARAATFLHLPGGRVYGDVVWRFPCRPALPVTPRQQLDFFGTVRARVGLVVAPTVLLYATGGLAYGQVECQYHACGCD